RFLDEIDRVRTHAAFAEWSRTRPGAANRCLPILRHMFRTATDWGLLPEGHDPTFGIVPNRPRTRGRHLTEDELERMGRALKVLARRYPVQVQIVQLILLTGCRPSEILSLRHDDMRGRILRIADSKTGPRTVELSAVAQAVFASVEQRPGSHWLFPSPRNPRRHRATLHSFRDNQLLPQAGIAHLRRHDLRHTFASYAAMNGENAPAVMKMLGHASIRATDRYMHLSSDNALHAAELVSSHLFGLINGDG
ncbi:MAG: site-specific integrase, partial [Novosphingobium sp.]|nr:site-specific integrase [Novosphingobium sp.]